MAEGSSIRLSTLHLVLSTVRNNIIKQVIQKNVIKIMCKADWVGGGETEPSREIDSVGTFRFTDLL